MCEPGSGPKSDPRARFKGLKVERLGLQFPVPAQISLVQALPGLRHPNPLEGQCSMCGNRKFSPYERSILEAWHQGENLLLLQISLTRPSSFVPPHLDLYYCFRLISVRVLSFAFHTAALSLPLV